MGFPTMSLPKRAFEATLSGFEASEIVGITMVGIPQLVGF